MAAPTLYHFELTLQHVDKAVEQALSLRTARHPSETLARVWLRVLGLAWQWREGIAFGPGLSDPETPDILADDLTGRRMLWMRVGKADPLKIQRVADQNPDAHVAVLFESPDRMEAFVADANRAGASRLGEVELAAVDPALIAALAEVDDRRFRGSCTIVGDHFYFERGAQGGALDGALSRARVG